MSENDVVATIYWEWEACETCIHRTDAILDGETECPLVSTEIEDDQIVCLAYQEGDPPEPEEPGIPECPGQRVLFEDPTR